MRCLKTRQIALDIRENGIIVRQLPLRRIAYWSEQHHKCYEFITNIYNLQPRANSKSINNDVD